MDLCRSRDGSTRRNSASAAVPKIPGSSPIRTGTFRSVTASWRSATVAGRSPTTAPTGPSSTAISSRSATGRRATCATAIICASGCTRSRYGSPRRETLHGRHNAWITQAGIDTPNTDPFTTDPFTTATRDPYVGDQSYVTPQAIERRMEPLEPSALDATLPQERHRRPPAGPSDARQHRWPGRRRFGLPRRRPDGTPRDAAAAVGHRRAIGRRRRGSTP